MILARYLCPIRAFKLQYKDNNSEVVVGKVKIVWNPVMRFGGAAAEVSWRKKRRLKSESDCALKII